MAKIGDLYRGCGHDITLSPRAFRVKPKNCKFAILRKLEALRRKAE
jgi:hypothetical protein